MDLIFRLEALLWGGPLLLILLGSHLFFTVYLKVPQKDTLRGIRLSLSRDRDAGGISPFGALSTSLAAAIGTGNIIGMASAVALGGPGAIFWCWVTGILGMATRYAETVLTLKYRKPLPEGRSLGGAMYLLSGPLHRPGLGAMFSLLGIATALFTGAMIQSNAVGVSLHHFGISNGITAPVLTVAAGAILLGGARRIAAVCEKLVPAMAGLYLLGCLMVLFANRNQIVPALRLIVTSVFSPGAATGGLAASGFLAAIKYGTARGLFTNEAGMGTGPLATAAGPCRSPQTEALVGMTGVFWDTVVICALTGVTLVSALLAQPELFSDAGPGQMCALAFGQVPGGSLILTLSLSIFAFATIIGWSHYGSVCWEYLWKKNTLPLYQMLYLAAVFLGVFLKLEVLWSLGGILAGLMTLPNLWSLFRLRQQTRPPEAKD